MTFWSVSMLALKAISEPLEFVVLRVIKVSRSELEISESLVFLIAVLNLSTILELTATPVAEFAGTNSKTEGARVVAIDPLPRCCIPTHCHSKAVGIPRTRRGDFKIIVNCNCTRLCGTPFR